MEALTGLKDPPQKKKTQKTEMDACKSMEIGVFELERVSQRRLDGSPPTCIIIGSRGKGKSWVARMLIAHARRAQHPHGARGVGHGGG